MSEIQIIEFAVARATRRRRLQRALNGLAVGLFAGGIALLVAVACYKALPIRGAVISAAAISVGVLAAAGFVAGGWRKATLMETARWIDERKQLKERLSTALEVSGQKGSEDWKQLLLADAARHAQTLDPRQLLSLRLPGVARWALLALVLAGGLGFVPEYRSKAYVKQQQDAANIKEVGKNLAELTRRDLLQKPPSLAPTEKALEQMAELGDKLGKQTLTKSEALKDLSSLTKTLAEQEQKLERSPAIERLERAAREPGGASTATPDSLQKQMDAIQKALGNAAGKTDKLDKLAKEMQKLQQQAAGAASKDGAAAQAAKEQLAQSLANLARQAQEAGASLEGLEEAIKALQSNNIDQFIKDLDLVSHDLEKMRDLAKAMQALQQQMAQLGKDLAEQLQKGQAQAAQQSLQKMIEQLKLANLSREELQKIIDEVERSVDPGSQYGKVGEFLKQAAQQSKSGDKSAAAQSLAQAKDELQKLMDQLADSDALEGALSALERAQMAIASGMSWSQCQGGGKCKSCNGQGCANCKGRGWGHGAGRGASGVGTWADEYDWTYFSDNDGSPVDNSGIQRPDMDSRGTSNRPDDPNPNLRPDKVKGQMSPGGSMPSITLKGVSIKGASNVRFEEAATAAQQDAQSALNQDQVPRAYQNAVRDYFDDLKK
jgi:hypothetical protein